LKILRNPIVTGLLVLAAVGMVFYQIYAPRWERARAAVVPRPIAAAVAAVAHVLAPPPALVVPHAAANETLPELAPDTSIDRDYAKAHFDNWVESPARDPFLLIGVQPVEPQEVDSETNSPIKKMKLKGILDQTGSRIAVIDHEAYRQGDEIQGYRLIQIGIDEVWFQGPKKKERLGLDKLPLRTNFIPHRVTAPARP
jgi:hypothetical protein